MDRGKRLAQGNIIGEKGELVFREWAIDHHLTANKTTTDIGIDFFCQVTAPIAGSESTEGQGPILAAQIKTVEDAKGPRLVLDRIDATNLLCQTHATCLFGLKLSDRSVHFQFLDRGFMDRLVAFLDGDHHQLSISYKAMASDSSLFMRLLKRYTNPFEQTQLRVHLIKQRVKSGIPGAHLSIESTDDETVCKVFVPWISSAFSIQPEAKEEVRLRLFRDGMIDLRQQGVELHPAIKEALKATNSSAAFLAGVSAQIVPVEIRWQGASATQSFEYREFGSEFSYVHRSGLRITMNRATTHTEEGHVHALESEVFQPAHPTPLAGSPILFFRMFRPGVTIVLRPGWEIPLETFGNRLTSIGGAVHGLPELSTALGQSLRRIALGDLRDEEFARSTWFLQALLLDEVSLGMLANGFIVGPAADMPLDQVPSIPVSMTLPVALNWKEKGFVIWIECSGEAFLHDDLICGVRVKSHTSWRIQKRGRFEKSIYPELWFAKEWPAVPIREDLTGTMNWTYDGSTKHPYEAVIRRASVIGTSFHLDI